jgi:hypothetical protein
MHELVGREIEKYPNIGGFLWRMRSDRVKVSYGRHDVEMFCRETGKEMPEGDAAAIANWASKTMAKEYHDWWHGKRRDFHVKLRDKLRSYRPDLKLYYYNWDPDRWNLESYHMTPQDWTDRYNVHKSLEQHKRQVAHLKRNRNEDFAEIFREGRHQIVDQQHKLLRPELYNDVDGVVLFGPVSWHYLADNEPYIQNFRTGDGMGLCMLLDYAELARDNVQNDHYESAELTPAGPQFSMAEEVLSFFHGDPNVITWTPYTIGRSFITEHRRFAQAFLALPDMRGVIVEDAVDGADAKDVRVRAYRTGDGRTYVSVVSRAFSPSEFTVTIPDAAPGSQVTDLVSGAALPANMANGKLSFKVQSRAMELNSFLLAP